MQYDSGTSGTCYRKNQGFCIGGGLEIAAACDFRIGDYTVVCGMPEVKVGVPSVIEANLLLGLIGWGKARELMLRGNMIDAEECFKIGLIQHLIKTDLLSSFIDDICREIVANGTNALRLQKQLILEWERAMSSNSIAASVGYFQENFESEECSGLTKKFFKKKLLTEFFVKVDHYLTGFHKQRVIFWFVIRVINCSSSSISEPVWERGSRPCKTRNSFSKAN